MISPLWLTLVLGLMGKGSMLDKIGDQFEAYKRAQEDGLKHIKDKARQQEADQECLLEETRQTLHKLRWALAVKENVADAQ